MTTATEKIAKAFDPETSPITNMAELDSVITYLGEINKGNVQKHARPKGEYEGNKVPAPPEPVQVDVSPLPGIMPAYVTRTPAQAREYWGISSF